MDDLFAKRVRSAAIAGWWTVLIAGIWMTAAWLVWIFLLLPCQPEWVMCLWGGAEYLNWRRIYHTVFQFIAVWKLILFVFLMVTIWMTLWARRLKRSV